MIRPDLPFGEGLIHKIFLFPFFLPTCITLTLNRRHRNNPSTDQVGMEVVRVTKLYTMPRDMGNVTSRHESQV